MKKQRSAPYIKYTTYGYVVGTKCSVIAAHAYTPTIPAPENKAKIGRYAAKNGPARATRHLRCLKQPGEGSSPSEVAIL